VKITASNLIRWTGLSAMVAGTIFAGIQPIHPPDILSSVTTNGWGIINYLKTAMSFLFLLGITGVYARQVNKAGLLGLVGFLLLSIFWTLQTAFAFTDAFILPPLATAAPKFVEGVLAVVSGGHASDINLGALPALLGLGGILYMLGGLLFGIATIRVGILSRWAAALLAVASVLTPAAALLPHQIQRLAAIPVALALAWLGYTLWSERREQASELVPGKGSPQRLQPAAE
jgi:hypothetical protein